jgi:diguanylate cyclase (GGDEF)-like protein
MISRKIDASDMDFRAHYQISDRLQVIKVMKFLMWFYLPLILLDYALINNSVAFSTLLILKILALTYSWWLIRNAKRLMLSKSFPRHVLFWAASILVLQLLSNVLLPKNYLGHYLIDAWICVIFPIVIPLNQKKIRLLMIGFLLSSLLLVYFKEFPNEIYKLTTIGFMIIATYSGFAIAKTITKYRKDLLNAERKIDHIASTDPLTGIANRKEFLRLTDCELQRSSRLKKPLSLMVLDVSDFQEINVNHGSASADIVLMEVSRRLHRATRNYDCLARYGTEEFGVLLPEATSEVVEQIAKRSVATIKAMPVAVLGKELKVSATVGFTTMLEGDTLDSMLRRVDEALLNAKHTNNQSETNVVFA